MEIGLKVTPESLYIEGPYDKQKWTRFALINELPKNQVFKIKSTRPESISVSPNSGFIKSYERIEILVTLAGDCFDPMIRNREKFLIQSAFTVVPCSAWKETSPREVFKNVAKPSEAKLSLKFLSPMLSKNLEKEIESKSSPRLPTEHQKQPNKQNGKRGNDLNQFQNGFDNSDEVNDGYKNGVHDADDERLPLQNSYNQDEPTVTQLCYNPELNSKRPASQILMDDMKETERKNRPIVSEKVLPQKTTPMELEIPKESIQKPSLLASASTNMVDIKRQNKPRTSLNGTASSEQFKTEEESNDKLDYPQSVLEKVTSTKWDWTKDVASNIKELKDRVAHLEAKTDELRCKNPEDEIKDGTTKSEEQDKIIKAAADISNPGEESKSNFQFYVMTALAAALVGVAIGKKV